ncbi:hypothetical protein BST61_g6947 [Cercospora zeina]
MYKNQIISSSTDSPSQSSILILMTIANPACSNIENSRISLLARHRRNDAIYSPPPSASHRRNCTIKSTDLINELLPASFVNDLVCFGFATISSHFLKREAIVVEVRQETSPCGNTSQDKSLACRWKHIRENK